MDCAMQVEGADLSQLEFSETGEFCKAVRTKDDGEGTTAGQCDGAM